MTGCCQLYPTMLREMLGNYQQIFRQRAFAWFWLGFTFSMLGDAMTRTALTWFVYQTTQSAEALGWLMFWYTGPVVVGGLLAGWLLDRFDRRSVMIADSLIRGAAVALVPLLHAAGQLALWHIYVVAGVYGFLMMVSLAGGPALIPALVRREQLSTANALETLSYMLGGVAGPLLAGRLTPWIGAPNLVALDALSYCAFAFALSRLPAASGAQLVAQPGGQASRLGEAVRLLLTNKILFSTTFMYLTANLGGGLLAVGLPIFTDQVLGGGSELYGALLGALSLGEVVSAFLAGMFTLPAALGALICLALILSGVSLALLLVGHSLPLVAAGLFLFGLFSAPLTIWAQTLRMQIIPERLRGRAFALLRMLMQSGNPLGGALAGGFLPALGLPATLALAALLVGGPGLIGYQVKDLRQAGSPNIAPDDRAEPQTLAAEGEH